MDFIQSMFIAQLNIETMKMKGRTEYKKATQLIIKKWTREKLGMSWKQIEKRVLSSLKLEKLSLKHLIFCSHSKSKST